MFKINECTLGSDCYADSSITSNNGEKTLSLSAYSLGTLNSAANYFLFFLNPIAEKEFIHEYYVVFGNPYEIEYMPIDIEDLEYDDYLTFELISSAAATVAPTAAPATAVPSTAKPAATKKATTTKTSSKKDNSPKTGDSNNFILLVSLMAVSVVSMGVVGYKKFRKN